MEASDYENNYDRSLKSVSMEDSLFPFISDNYSQFMVSGDSISGQCKGHTTITSEEHSDMEADLMPESQMELTEVDVYTRLEHKERDLILAAELGKSLLEKNEELTKENERLNQEFHSRLEALEQEKHELRRRLEFKTSEYESNTIQLNNDIKRSQEELVERKAMLAAVEREKSRAVEELSEQNQKLLGQLHRASEAEQQLSAQVQQLRKEFLERTNSSSVRILQLESLREEIQEDSEMRARLETNFDAMRDETVDLRDSLSTANEKVHHLERQLHDRERELKRVAVELNDAHLSNRQLQIRIDELREEMSLQMSFSSHGNSSLLAELEQSGVDCNGILDLGSSETSQNLNDSIDENNAPRQRDIEKPKPIMVDDMNADLTLRCYQNLLNGISNCHHQLFELKQEMWEMYQRVQSICTILRTYVKKQQTSDAECLNNDDSSKEDDKMSHTTTPINLTTVLDDLSSLVHETIKAKESYTKSDNSIIEMLKEKQSCLTRERDEAVATRNFLEVNLASAKVDLMSVNSQLLEAIQQKLHQQKELEAWQEDMELMIQKALNDRNDSKKAVDLRKIQSTNQETPPQRSSWFASFRRNRVTSESSSADTNSSNPTSPQTNPKGSTTSDASNSTPKPSRFSAWLKRRQCSDQEVPSSDSHTPP